MLEILVAKRRDGMRNRAEIIDDHMLPQAQLLFHQRRADDPWVVGQLKQVTVDRTGECHP